MEDWVTIKNLKAKNPDMSNRKIAGYLHISHNTVKKALEGESPPVYQRPEKLNPDIEPFKEVIFEMVNVKKFKGSRILEEIKSKGYKGGKTSFYFYLKKIKLELKQKYFTPYETAPGEQSQFDWSPYTVLIGNELTVIYVFSYINGFSRYLILEVSLSQTQPAVFEALENSIRECNGVCARIQTDNAKSFVNNASVNNFQWNQRYIHFCGHYGFSPSRSLPSHPWSKGKVEKPFSYLENHFIAGGEFTSFEDLYDKLKVFQKQVNQRIHSTTKAIAEEMFAKEQPSLLSLPEERYIGTKEEFRKVTYDCLISFGGSRYSVPWMFAGKQVWIRISKGYILEVYSQSNKLITTHKLSLKKSAVIIQQEHYRGNNSDRGNFERLKMNFLNMFPGKELFIEKLKASKRINSSYQLFQILEIMKLYCTEDSLDAINVSLQYNVFNSSFIAGYLEKNHKQKFDVKESGSRDYSINSTDTNGTTLINVKRDMNEYRLFNDGLNGLN
ncbi:MAG: IS21 family transposase [Bacteroidota bacterium]|nr:IS21 family transposase [Bacteroidota bacterium]